MRHRLVQVLSNEDRDEAAAHVLGRFWLAAAPRMLPREDVAAAPARVVDLDAYRAYRRGPAERR